MPLLVRRINRVKWDQIVETGIDKDVSADAITNCLKTYSNDLSVWHIDTEADLEKAILALITGPRQTNLSKLDIVIIDESLVLNKGLSLAVTKGDTTVKDLVSMHKDITNLTYSKLGIVKDLIVDSIKENRTLFYTRKQLKDLLSQALKDGKVDKLDLPEDLVTAEKL